MASLRGQTALVTGASSGIGRAIAAALAGAGAKVAVNHPPKAASAERAAALIDEIAGEGGVAAAAPGDVSREDDVAAMFEATLDRFGRLDILISNAGVEDPAPIADMTLEQWRRVIEVNLTGSFLCARAAVRIFRRQGIDPALSAAAGKILFTSSVHEIIPWAFQTNYAASKGGLMLLMKSLAQEVAPERIRVNSLAPGAIRTPINREAWGTDAAMRKLLTLIPYGRIGEPEDVAKAAVWLASDESDYVAGATLIVDGGMTLYPGFRGEG